MFPAWFQEGGRYWLCCLLRRHRWETYPEYAARHRLFLTAEDVEAHAGRRRCRRCHAIEEGS